MGSTAAVNLSSKVRIAVGLIRSDQIEPDVVKETINRKDAHDHIQTDRGPSNHRTT